MHRQPTEMINGKAILDLNAIYLTNFLLRLQYLSFIHVDRQALPGIE